jgi:tetratricopeptide (TPR) repeat protein
MNKYPYLILLILSMAVTCGFNWDAESTDNRGKAFETELSGTKVVTAQSGKVYGLADAEQDLSPEVYIREGDEYLLSREYGKAIEKYEEALKRRPQWLRAMTRLGDAHMAAGHDDEAISFYQKVVSLDAGNSGIHYSLGILLERKGALDKAVAQYLETLRLDPGNGDARRRLADIYTLRGKYLLSMEQYKKLIALRSGNPLLHFKLARVYEKNRDFQEAIDSYRTAIRLDAGNVETRNELALLYSRRGMATEAIDQYREVLKLKKDDFTARNALTALYVKLRKYDDLFALMKEGVDLFPKDPTSHYKLGIMYDFRKDFDSAIAEYLAAIALKGDYAKALNALGKTYFKTGRLDKAREALEAAKKADPNFSEPRELLTSINDDAASGRSKHLKKKHHKASKPKERTRAKKTTKKPKKRLSNK